MPRSGYKVITVKQRVFDAIKNLLKEAKDENREVKDRNGDSITSISGFVEDAVLMKVEPHD